MPKELTTQSVELLSEDGITFLRIRLSNHLVLGANLSPGMDVSGLIEQLNLLRNTAVDGSERHEKEISDKS